MAKQVPGRNGGTLTRPEKGETMNPNGRPKGAISFHSILKKVLDAEITVEEAGEIRKMTRYEAMLINVAKDAVGHPDPSIRLKAVQWLVDRKEGKAVETSNINATVQSFTTPGAVSPEDMEQILRIVKIEPKSEE